MRYLNAKKLESLLDYPSLIEELRRAFSQNFMVPLRHHHDYDTNSKTSPSTLLLMPAWQGQAFFGLKIVTVTPDNAVRSLPTIQGLYLLFESISGRLLAQMDARTLTNWRTAAASALASSYLSRPESRTLLMIGTGALAPYLVRAHTSVRPIRKVLIWGRNYEKATRLSGQLSDLGPQDIEAVSDLEAAVRTADIISAATLSRRPLIKGQWLKAGGHLDLVGSYRPDMREADDDCIRRASVFADLRSSATKESGDLAIPIQRGLLSLKDVRADLFELSRGQKPGRRSEAEITLFKSVGHALEDLAAARLIYRKLLDKGR